MSSEAGARPIRYPAADFNQVKIPRVRQSARHWFRIHQYRDEAIYFSLNSGHRFSHPDCLSRILYLAADLETCLFERFGDKAYDGGKAIARSLWEAHCASAITVPDLQVCDLTGSKTLSAMRVDLAALMHPELATPQEWGLAIQRHPAKFQGIKFRSRFNGKACLAVFEREDFRLKGRLLGTLSECDAAVDWLGEHKVSLY